MAYTSDEAGRDQVYVQSFPVGAGKFPVSSGDGTQPRWSKNGKELFYIAGDGKLMAVEVKTAPAFEAGAVRALFDSRISRTGRVTNQFQYTVTADGKRFLIISNADPTEASHSPHSLYRGPQLDYGAEAMKGGIWTLDITWASPAPALSLAVTIIGENSPTVQRSGSVS